MSNTQPFTEAHAVAAVDVALIFEEKLSSSTRLLIASSLKSHLKEGFRKLAPKERDSKIIAFQRKIDEDIAEEVHIHDRFVHVSLWDYRGWSITKKDMVGRVEPVLEMARGGELKLTSAGLVFRDVFINNDPSTYAPADVFRASSRFLPPLAFSAGKIWRHTFSWANEKALGLKLRSNLTVKASIDSIGEDDEDGHITEIAHRQEIMGNISGDPAVEWSSERLNAKLDSAHQHNKDILIDLLSFEMCQKIGLKETS